MNEREALAEEMKKLTDRGARFSFAATDLDGNVILSENAHWRFCSQSTIKAPYVCSLIDGRPEIFDIEIEKIKNVITVSDNADYEELRKKYGDQNLLKWCYNMGVDEKTVSAMYPRNITVLEMAKLWIKMYEFLSKKAPESLKKWLYGTKYSAIYETLGGKYLTWTKSGWENGIGDGDDIDAEGVPDPRFTDGDPLNDETATNDTGIVFAERRPYILAIFTDIPTSPHSLYGLVNAIDELLKVI